MAIYEFHCAKCGADFERQRPASKMPSTAKCASCGARARRKLSMFTVIRGAAPDLVSSDLDPGELPGGDDDFDLGDDFDF